MNDLSVLRQLAIARPLGSVETGPSDANEAGGYDRRPFRRRAVRRAEQGSMRGIAKSPVRDDWHSLRVVSGAASGDVPSGSPLVDAFRADPAARAFDMLRTRLLQTLRAQGWTRVGIVAPTRGCGSTFTAVNLALSLARIPDSRNMLLDLNLRRPGIASALDLTPTGTMRAFLQGDVTTGRHLVRARETLALGLASGPDRDAAEMLHDRRTGDTLHRMITDLTPDVVLYDLPPMLECDDLAAFLPHVDCVFLVADGTRSEGGDIANCERVLQDNTEVLGVILNRARRQQKNDHGL